jgi:hypothetical protein
MNSSLRNKIDRIRNVLSNNPNGPLIGNLPVGNVNALKFAVAPLDQYYGFMAYCNGGRFGSSLVLTRFEDLDRLQFVTPNLPGDRDQWLAIGGSVDAPLAIDKKSGNVYLFSLEPGIVDVLPEPIGRIGEKGVNLGLFNDFLDYYAFGEGVLIIMPRGKDDEWYQMLRELSFVS